MAYPNAVGGIWEYSEIREQAGRHLEAEAPLRPNEGEGSQEARDDLEAFVAKIGAVSGQNCKCERFALKKRAPVSGSSVNYN